MAGTDVIIHGVAGVYTGNPRKLEKSGCYCLDIIVVDEDGKQTKIGLFSDSREGLCMTQGGEPWKMANRATMAIIREKAS